MKLKIYEADLSSRLDLPLSEESIKAGFPSLAQDYMSESIDLNRELIRHPATTFYARTCGDSMTECGIDDGDLLIIDKGIRPSDGDIVVALIDGEFTLKKVVFEHEKDCISLVAANKKYAPIRVTEENQFLIWGVLTYNIKKQYGRKR